MITSRINKKKEEGNSQFLVSHPNDSNVTEKKSGWDIKNKKQIHIMTFISAHYKQVDVNDTLEHTFKETVPKK